jgi:hypothetical protein
VKKNFEIESNVNKGVLCLIISYLQIKSYNVLNYNNCSTDWPFPLTDFHQSNVGSVDSIYNLSILIQFQSFFSLFDRVDI